MSPVQNDCSMRIMELQIKSQQGRPIAPKNKNENYLSMVRRDRRWVVMMLGV